MEDSIASVGEPALIGNSVTHHTPDATTPVVYKSLQSGGGKATCTNRYVKFSLTDLTFSHPASVGP